METKGKETKGQGEMDEGPYETKDKDERTGNKAEIPWSWRRSRRSILEDNVPRHLVK